MDTNEQADEAPVTINRLVSYNVRRARLRSGWKQDQLATELNRVTRGRWSATTVSAAERSMVGGRVKVWSANELVALSQIFGLPVAYFLLPPDDHEIKSFNSTTAGVAYTVEDGNSASPNEPIELSRAQLLQSIEPRVARPDYEERVRAEATRDDLEWTPGRYIHKVRLSANVAFKQLSPERQKAIRDALEGGGTVLFPDPSDDSITYSAYDDVDGEAMTSRWGTDE